MIGWLKKIVGRLIGETSNTLEVFLDGKIQRAVAMSAMGLRLHCVVPTQAGARTVLIPVEYACDRRHFWRLWERLGGRAEWEDGSKFKPPT